MKETKMFQILRKVRNFLFSTVNKEFLIFLFFFALSGTFWLLMAMNETYEREISIPVRIVDMPKNVVLTSDTTTNVKVTVKDKGYSLLSYLYGDKINTIKVKFDTYTKKDGTGLISAQELQKLINQQMFSSSHIVSIKPDKVEFFYNYGRKKRVPIKLFGKVTAGQSYYLSKVFFTPDSVDVYASHEVLDSIKYVNTERLNMTGLTDSVVRTVALSKTRGVKYVPEKVKISIYADILTEESADVPITAINMPAGKILRTFPSRVTVTFTVGAGMFRSIHADRFKVVVDYNELIDNPSDKCNVYLRSVPHGVWNARLSVSQVDYLIEEQ